MEQGASYCQECHVPLQIKGESESECAKLKHINQQLLFLPKKNALEQSVTDLSNAFQQVQTESRAKLLQEDSVRVNCPICADCFEKITTRLDAQILAA